MKGAVSLLFTLALLGAGCSSSGEQASSTTAAVAEKRADGTASDLRINELQYIGTHNSYHIAPEDKLFEAEKAAMAALGDDAAALGDIDSLLYTHDSLTDQLNQGIRAFELDIFADPDGGLFADPLAPSLLSITDTPLPQNMDEPGYKVLHIQDIDFMSTCTSLVRCLTEIRDWSDDNSGHVPIIIQIELKDDMLPAPIDVTQVIEIGPAELDALDTEIRSVFSPERLITPDDVRGDGVTLSDAILDNGWPTLSDSRGKVMFFLDNGASVHDGYRDGALSLDGRVAFTSAATRGDQDFAISKLNNPMTPGEIQGVVQAGYIVRTRADADLEQSWTNDTTMRDAALSSGAQIVSTDFPHDKTSDTGYVVSFGPGLQVRCNAVIVPTCPSGALEP